ncbi:hypothetical protein BpHYR1_035686 [Brachionus plicatilis]|uniref:Uncharacterized protein n=1 Tax=Brachionus plicatilis TaxID=10195 RepID=A0A3M7QMD9_BRAPC|nr:hypothetical protein BpHYR1_035686 [Brachionus plicatilis]
MKLLFGAKIARQQKVEQTPEFCHIVLDRSAVYKYWMSCRMMSYETIKTLNLALGSLFLLKKRRRKFSLSATEPQ